MLKFNCLNKTQHKKTSLKLRSPLQKKVSSHNKKPNTTLYIFCLLLAMLSAQSSQARSSKIISNYSIPAMGTIWNFNYIKPNSDHNVDWAKIMFLLNQYEQTFSDWSDNSELRTLERKANGTTHTASSLFIRGLNLSSLDIWLEKTKPFSSLTSNSYP